MKSIIRNFTTAFFAGFFNSIMLFIYIGINKGNAGEQEITFFVFLTLLFMGIASFIGFLGLSILSVVSSIYKWSESGDYISKIIFALALYLPLYFIMSTIDWIFHFWFWSLIGTIIVISFDYKSMFLQHFTYKKSKKSTIKNHSIIPYKS